MHRHRKYIDDCFKCSFKARILVFSNSRTRLHKNRSPMIMYILRTCKHVLFHTFSPISLTLKLKHIQTHKKYIDTPTHKTNTQTQAEYIAGFFTCMFKCHFSNSRARLNASTYQTHFLYIAKLVKNIFANVSKTCA